MVPLLLLPLLLGGEDPEYQLRVKESVTVQEGLCVHVPCSFSYPWKWWYPRTMLYIYWFREKDTSSNHYPVATNNPQRAVKTEARGRFRLVGDPWAYNCSLRIRDAMRSDEGVYFFRVERGEKVRYTYTHTTMTLRVAALTQEPDIHFPEPLKSGWPAELTCSLPGSCEGERPLTFSWVGAALDSLDPETLHSSVLAFTPRLQDHGTNLTCQVKLPEVQATVERTTWLNVSYAPHNLTISIFSNVTALSILENTSSLLIWEGQALRLLCAAASNPPAELSWFRGSPALNATPMYRTHILELPQVGAAEEGVLTCRAQNSLGSQHVSLRLSVVCPPRLLGPSCSWEGEALGCTCSARALPAPTLRWRLGEGLLEGNHSDASLTVTSSSEGPWANSSLSLRGPLGSGLRLSCEARNAHGEQSAAVLLLPDKKGLLSKALGGGIFLGMGITTLLFLCLILVTKTLRKKQAQAGTPAHAGTPDQAGAPPQEGAPPQAGAPLKPKATRRSTILDYINVVPNPGPLARNRNGSQNRKAMPSSPSQASPPGAPSQECKKNQKELHAAPHTCPGPRSSTQASESESNQENLHYAALTFSGLRPWDTRESKDTGPEYEDIKFH